MPESVEQREAIAQQFCQISKFPRCIGAIDCTHVRIQSPGDEEAEIYRNRKGFFSINVQTVSDPNLRIENIVARWPGSAHDSTIFQNCNLRQRFERGHFKDFLLVGESGYPVTNYLLTPLRNPRSRAEDIYNESQITTRNAVERSYGV